MSKTAAAGKVDTRTNGTSARAGDEDEVLRCEECRRILVRTTESGL